jgi:hypothetical protein
VTSPTVTRGVRTRSRPSVRCGNGRRRATLRARLAAVVVVLLGVALASPAQAAWIVPGLGGSMSSATLLATPTAPGASVSSGTATVTWTASAVIGTSFDASGYVVERIWRGTSPGPQGQVAGDVEATTGGCAGTVAALSCTTPHASGETWAYRVSPRFLSWSGAPSAESSPVTMASTPTVTAIALADAGTAGVVEAGDQIVLTFSEVLDAQSVCSGFSSSATGTQTATGMTFTLTSAGGGVQNVVTVTASGTCGSNGFGSLAVGGTGRGRYTFGTMTAGSSTLVWDPAARTITVTFGAVTTASNTGDGTAATAVYTPGALTASGLPISGTPVNSTTAQRF